MTEKVPEHLMQMTMLLIPAGRMGKPEGLHIFIGHNPFHKYSSFQMIFFTLETFAETVNCVSLL